MPASDGLVSPRLKTTSARRGALEARLTAALSGNLERASWQRCRRIGSRVGLLFFWAGRKRRELAISNVQMALGVDRESAQSIARRSAQNWGMTTCELLHLPGASPQQVRDYVAIEGLEHLQSALSGGRGAILLTAHLGNWELLAARLAPLLAPQHATSAIVRPLSNATLQEKLSSIRRDMGVSLISKHGAGRPALQALRRGEALIILPDRHAGAEGVLLPLLGRETRFEGAPARLAMMSGAPIVPLCAVRREPWLNGEGGLLLRIFPSFGVPDAPRAQREAAVTNGTRQVIAALEMMVRAHPEQWSWMLRRWRADDAAPQSQLAR